MYSVGQWTLNGKSLIIILSHNDDLGERERERDIMPGMRVRGRRDDSALQLNSNEEQLHLLDEKDE